MKTMSPRLQMKMFFLVIKLAKASTLTLELRREIDEALKMAEAEFEAQS